MKVLVTGSTGQLGSELKDICKINSDFEFIFADRSDLDLSNTDNISDYLSEIKPDIIINTAAYTAVDKAETEKKLADLINHSAVAKMAEWGAMNNSKIIHISTDYVFDGTNKDPLNENDFVNPINHYGATKYEGEQALQKSGADFIIIRTSWVYSTHGSNFVKTMLRLMSEREDVSVVSDQIGSPTYARDLAKVIIQMIRSGIFEKGIYHYSNEGAISWYDFAVEIKSITDNKCTIHAIPSSKFPTPAQRPQYSLLDKTKIKKAYGLDIPYWKDSLKECLYAMLD